MNILLLPHYNSSPSIREQSTKKSLMEKRKRDSLEKIILSQKNMEKNKKIKLSPTLKNPKLSATITLIKQEDEATKSISEVKSVVTMVDALNTHTLSSDPTQCKGFPPTFDEMLNTSFENGKRDGNSKIHKKFLIDAPMILDQTIERVGNNADDIHVTCEGFPMESFLETMEKSESSTSKLKKNESNSKFVTKDNRTSEVGVPLNSKKNKAMLAKERRKASKVAQNKRSKKSSNIIIDTTLKEPTKRKPIESNVSKTIQNKRKKITHGKIQGQMLDTSHCHDFQKPCEDLMQKYELTCLEDQESLGLHLATITKPTTIGENLLEKEFFESLPTSDNVRTTLVHNITLPLEQKFESKCEEFLEQKFESKCEELLEQKLQSKCEGPAEQNFESKCEVSFNFTSTYVLF